MGPSFQVTAPSGLRFTRDKAKVDRISREMEFASEEVFETAGAARQYRCCGRRERTIRCGTQGSHQTPATKTGMNSVRLRSGIDSTFLSRDESCVETMPFGEHNSYRNVHKTQRDIEERCGMGYEHHIHATTPRLPPRMSGLVRVAVTFCPLVSSRREIHLNTTQPYQSRDTLDLQESGVNQRS